MPRQEHHDRTSRPRVGPPADGRGARARRLRLRAGERRRPVPAPRAEPGRHGARARPRAPRSRARRGPAGGPGAAPRGRRDAGRGLPVRPGAGRALQLARGLLRLPDRRRRGLAARRAPPPGGRADRAAPAHPAPDRRADQRHRPLRARRRRPRRGARRDGDAGPDVPAARAALDVRALPPLVRLLRGARRRAAARRARLGRREPRRRGLRQRHAAAHRPRVHREHAGLLRRHRAHARRDVAGRRADRRARDVVEPADDVLQARRGPRDLVVERVRLRRPRRRLHPRQRPHAAEAQPVRAVDHPGRVRRAHRPARRVPRGDQEPVGPQRQPDLRLRRGAPRARPGRPHRAPRRPAWCARCG